MVTKERWEDALCNPLGNDGVYYGKHYIPQNFCGCLCGKEIWFCTAPDGHAGPHSCFAKDGVKMWEYSDLQVIFSPEDWL